MGSKDINTLFNEINRIITLDPKDRPEYMKHCNIIKKVVNDELMKKSDLFKKISNGIENSGSYRDNLKVSKPDEYDLNIIIKLPLSPDKVKVSQAKPGYLKINISRLLEDMKNSTGMAQAHKDLAKLTDSSGYLLQNQWIAWFEGLFFQSLKTIKTALVDQYTLSHYKQGPAQTLDVTSVKDCNISFSIDFVPGIRFGLDKWIAARKIPKCTKKEDEHWMAIPKPNKFHTGDNPLWIASYPAQDHNIIHDKNRLKDSIRFIKKIRDTQDVSNLKSFFIKNIIMLETDKRHRSYWDSPLSVVLKDMLDAVITCLENGNIPSYWDKNLNLIEALHMDQTQDMANKLKNVRKIWDNALDRERIIATILTKNEVERLMDTSSVLENSSGGYYKPRVVSRRPEQLPSVLGDFSGRCNVLDYDSDEYYEPRVVTRRPEQLPSVLGDFSGRCNVLDYDSDEYYEPRVVTRRPEQSESSNLARNALIGLGVGLLVYWALKPNRND